MMIVYALHPETTADHVGLVPGMLRERDRRSAIEQLDANYRHGGGWRHQEGFTLDDRTGALKYPGDAPLIPLASMCLHGTELIVVYNHAYVAIFQDDRTFEICRMD